MKVLGKAWVTVIIFSMIFVFASCLLAQDAEQQAPPAETTVAANATVEPAAVVTPTSLPVPTEMPEPAVKAEPIAPVEMPAPAEVKPAEWVWGEVVSVDTEKKQIVLKHLDYDTYEEVQTTLNVGDKTLFENVVGLGEIKIGNHLTADFKIVSGSNIADLVVVEKDVQEESAAPETLVQPETAAAPEATVAPELIIAPTPAPQAPAAVPAQAVNETK